MPSADRRRLATLPTAFVEGAAGHQLADWLDATEPDAAVLTGGTGSRARQRLSRHTDRPLPLLDPRLATAGTAGRGDGPTGIAIGPDVESLERELSSGERTQADGFPRVVVTPALELEVDTTALDTTLHGREAIEAAAPAHSPTNDRVILSTGLPIGFRDSIEEVTLVGIGEPDDPSESGLAVVEVRRDGTVLSETVDPDRLGLQALSEVGPKRAETLHSAGYDSRTAVAEATHAELQDLQGFGREVVETVQQSARAIAEGRVIPRSRSTLPTGDPLFVDIETDGLHPTVTWLVGVLDGGPADGIYHSFCNRDPADPGAAIEAFVDWYATEGQNRPLVAYNGRTFDFPVLRDHLQAYRPSLLPDFEHAERFDPYAWAVRDGNAALPGRTNTLEAVADALGYEPRTEGLTGAAVARRYREWLADPRPEREPDWDRLDGYCEDDTRALAMVYEAIREAGAGAGREERGGDTAAAGTRGSTRNRRETTTQGTLADW